MRIAGKLIRDRASRYFSGRMIDIGCDKKYKSLLIGEFVEEYVGLDRKDSLHGKANIDMLGSVYNIPVEDEFFSCVLCTAVLEHLEEPQKALYETYWVLKSGGYVLYTVPLFWHLHEEPRDFYRYTKFGIQYLFKKVSFEIVELKPLSGFWVTFGSEFNYYISSLARGPLRILIKPVITMNNLLFLALDKVDRKIIKGD